MRALSLVLFAAVMLTACHNPPKEAAASELEDVVDGKGYFVTLASKPTAPAAQKIYDKIHDSLDLYNRKRARAENSLDSYVEEFQATGYTSLKGGDDEIECDRDKCLLKLHARRVDKQKANTKEPPFAQQLYEAFLDANVPARAGTKGDDFIKTVTLGESKGVSVACTERRTAGGVPIDYGCLFDLDGLKGDAVASSKTLDKQERGKLFSCVLSPGIVKAAEEAKEGVDGGGLLTLTSGATDGSKPVGYLRYSRSKERVDLIDLYLCGDLSTDTFYLVGAGKDPREWVSGMQRSSPGASGVDTVDIEPAHHDEGDLTMRARVVAQSVQDVTLAVLFKIVKDGSTDVYGEDKFFVKLEKAWLK